ncbi:MAG: fatty acid--CoA ligase [Solirubrobacteraceae bacterium]
MLEGLMLNDFPLTLAHMRRRMRDVHGSSQVITLTDHGTTRSSFAECAERVDRLGRVLQRLGVQRGERVGTFAWNSQRHFELYMAIPCLGAVLHTLNIRLFAEQLDYIINHAQDRVVFIDDDLIELIEPLLDRLGGVRHWVVMGDGGAGALPDPLRYEELLAEAGEGAFDWPQCDEREAAALCYTSGTTGNPKGVLYSHRSIALHSTSQCLADSAALCERDRALVVVPMFHANAWGIPHAATLSGTDLVLPGPFLQAEPLAKLIAQERPTLMGCVPTIFQDLLRYADEHGADLSSLQKCLCGGSAVPRALIEAFEERHDVPIYQAWGMTETSPVATFARVPAGLQGGEAMSLRASQGRALPWVELRIVDDDGDEVAWDGAQTGEIEVRGPWVASRYYNDPTGDDKFDRGWLRTGDIASVDARAFVRISDRAKDVIKSGGEWISSVELENELMSHPDVLEAAVIAKPDERWSERPLACVVLRAGCRADAGALVEHLRSRVAKWWLPDEFAFIDAVPKTSVGKFDKKVLRAQLEDGSLAGRTPVGTRTPTA